MWTAASGMKNLQLKIDTISNNLANVNTVGFKGQRLEFQDIMYERMSAGDQLEDEVRPAPTEIGHGVKSSATLRSFRTGNLEQTENRFDMAINGPHFFTIVDANGDLRYTKDGSFKLSPAADGDGVTLVTSDGFFVQSDQGPIVFEEDVIDFSVSPNGTIAVKRAGEEEYEEIGSLTLTKFINPAGLEAMGKNLYRETAASGLAITDNTEGQRSEVLQGFIEQSNVQIVDEMINLIVAERAYEINSKSIQTADRMLEIANSLKR